MKIDGKEEIAIEFYDGGSSRQMKYVYPDSPHSFAGWLFYRHPDGQWVSLRKATDDDICKINAAVIRLTPRRLYMSDEQKGAVSEENRPKDECRRCHITMHLADGDDPEELCHSCAYAEIAALEQSLRERDQTIAELRQELQAFKPIDIAPYADSELQAENQKLRELVQRYLRDHICQTVSSSVPFCMTCLDAERQLSSRIADALEKKEPKL
jgi:hypothetical protein